MRGKTTIYVLVLLLAFAFIGSGQTSDDSSTTEDENQSSVNTDQEIEVGTLSSAVSSESVSSEKKGSTEIGFSYTEESLSNGYDPWRSASISIVHKFSQRKAIYGIYSETERFRKRDRQFLVGLYQPLSEKWTLFLEGNASPSHNVLSKWSALAQIERKVGKSLLLKTGYRRSKYAISSSNMGIAEAEKYWGNNRGAYTLYISNLENGGTSASHRIQYSRYYGERVNSVNISASYGRELESLGEAGLLESNVRNLSVYGKHWVKKSFGFNYGFTLHDQGSLYTRRGLTLGLRYKF